MIVNRKSLKLSAKLKPGMPPRGRQVKYPGSCSFLLFIFLAVWPVKAQVALASPNGEVQAKIEADLDGALCYSVTWKGMTTISRSRMGVTRDGIDLGKAVQIGSPVFSAIDETYPVLGGKRAARNHARALSLPLEAARGEVRTASTGL
jgi:Glycosyl-hydrolase 97 N-terminal